MDPTKYKSLLPSFSELLSLDKSLRSRQTLRETVNFFLEITSVIHFKNICLRLFFMVSSYFLIFFSLKLSPQVKWTPNISRKLLVGPRALIWSISVLRKGGPLGSPVFLKKQHWLYIGDAHYTLVQIYSSCLPGTFNGTVTWNSVLESQFR